VEYPALERIEQLVKSLDGLQQRMADRVDELRAQPVEVSDEAGLLRVVADHGGRIERVEISARAMRLGSPELSDEITALVRKAQQVATDRLQESMRETLGTDAAFPLD